VPRTLTDHDVKRKVLERRIEDLFHGAMSRWISSTKRTSRSSRLVRIAAMSPCARGPGSDAANSHAELLAHDERETRLAEAGRADQKDVVERFARAFARTERDGRAAPDVLLADELLEQSRPERLLDSSSSTSITGAMELGHAAALSARRTRSAAGSSDRRAPARLRLDERVAELDERVAGDDVWGDTAAGCRDGCGRRGLRASPFSSSTTLCAVSCRCRGSLERAVSSRAIARRSSPGVEPDTIASATLGPIPETDSRWMKSSRSSASAKP